MQISESNILSRTCGTTNDRLFVLSFDSAQEDIVQG